MKRLPLLGLVALAFLTACGPGPEPDVLLGEDKAASVVSTFLSAVQSKDDKKAKALTHSRPDSIIGDLEACRGYFFERRPTGKKLLEIGHEDYGGEWHIYVDYQLNYYGNQIKQLHFVLAPGEIPKVRGVTPIKPGQR
ncbi:hypothetical protein [Pelagicoccus mobilis]|uniref:Lipoprotein n=1 Tax=Pelagicoccus mobilis TaxID=415221 RepID=A0A934RQ18_9BACT|nr:hypothetical protein [Pelagicoccus mobilis]MBK1875395.1 hypothetical protein [Pelagicoccus mobilis]